MWDYWVRGQEHIHVPNRCCQMAEDALGHLPLRVLVICAEVHVLVGLYPSAPSDSGGNRLWRREHGLGGGSGLQEKSGVLPPWDGS